jgi:hypothetical protein
LAGTICLAAVQHLKDNGLHSVFAISEECMKPFEDLYDPQICGGKWRTIGKTVIRYVIMLHFIQNKQNKRPHPPKCCFVQALIETDNETSLYS